MEWRLKSQQLGRRNLTKEKRDEMIRRLAAAGVRQKDIAEKVGLTQQAVSKITKTDTTKLYEPQVNTTTPAAEIEALQRKLEEAEAARRSTEQRLSAVQSDLAAGILAAKRLMSPNVRNDEVVLSDRDGSFPSRFGSPKLDSPRQLRVEQSGARGGGSNPIPSLYAP